MLADADILTLMLVQNLAKKKTLLSCQCMSSEYNAHVD